jgi:nicotinamide mononucleotide (NMN) deamidase PncC
MSDLAQQAFIERVHASGKQLVLSITGGGSRAIASLLEVPGASASVISAVVPYAGTALEDWLGGPVDHFCSERTARAMAMAAFERSRQFSQADPQLLRGIGATASLATTRPKRGPHRIHVAWQSAETTVAVSCELAKGQRTRAEEEAIACQLIVAAVCDACGVDAAPLLDPSIAAALKRRAQPAPEPWRELLLGNRSSVAISDRPGDPCDRTLATGETAKPAILFPGAFNPIHSGHELMAELASQRIGAPTTFELSIINVDKPPLDFIELADRLRQLSGRRVLLSRAPTFAEKALLAPGCVFVVGIDTLCRIAEPRYYSGEVAHRDEAIDTIARQGCRFLVFGRIKDGRFLSFSELTLPTALRERCDEVPESTFRADISSTELRSKLPS